MRHTSDGLIQLQSLPLEAKIKASKERIRAWYEHWDGDVYLSFSGGADSTVLKSLIDSMYSDVPAVFVNTGLEFPEIRSFALAQKNVVRIDPKKKFYEVIKEYGWPLISKETASRFHAITHAKSDWAYRYFIEGVDKNGKPRSPAGVIPKKYHYLLDAPFKISNRCCNYLKKEPAYRYEKETGRKPFLGVRAEESILRRQQWLQFGCNVFSQGGGSRPHSTPLAFWTHQDVLHYLRDYNVPYCQAIYGDIIPAEASLFDEPSEKQKLRFSLRDRTGCIFCGFGIHLDKTPNRFQTLKETHPKQYDYVMNTLGMDKVLCYLKIEH